MNEFFQNIDVAVLSAVASFITMLGMGIWRIIEVVINKRNKEADVKKTEAEAKKEEATASDKMSDSWVKLNDQMNERLDRLQKRLTESEDSVTLYKIELDEAKDKIEELDAKYARERTQRLALGRRVTSMRGDLKAVIDVNTVLVKQLEANNITPEKYPPDITSLDEGIN